MAKRGAAVLEMPEPEYAPENGTRRRGASGSGPRLRRDPVEDFADEYGPAVEPERGRRAPVARSAVKLKLAGRLPLPSSPAGMIATGVALLFLLGGVFWLLAVTRTFLLQDARFRLAGAASIEFEGNHHLSRARLLALFADDIDRNIFGVSLDQRQADLEAISWVRRATVMRLLPGRLRVSLVERTPVAFVRQGGHIGLVDANGVLLDMPAGPQTEHYSFPVVTGIAASDPTSTRAARMKIYERFTTDLDAGGDAGGAKNTESLSEVDLSNPEDVKALVEEHGATVLVHFGEDQFLERYRKVKELLPQWHAQYPNLASADMRYEHEIPLAMAKPVAVTPLKPAAVNAPAKVALMKPLGRPIAAAKPPVKTAAAKVPPVTRASGAVPPQVSDAKRGATASVPAAQRVETSASSVSAAARSGFAPKTPSVVPKAVVHGPVKPAAKAPAEVAASRPKGPAANDRPSAAQQPVSRAGPHGKPSAGKPLVSSDTHPTPQAAQR